MEDEIHNQDIGQQSSDEDGEDLIDGMEKDYQQNEELDNYENIGIDNESQQELSMNKRMDADNEIMR